MMITREREHTNKVEKAKAVYSDMKEFFESEEKQRYLTTIIPRKDILLVLEELEKCFIVVEDYEKCDKIETWKRKLNRNLSPDILFDHLY